MTSKEDILALLKRAKKYVSDYITHEILKKRYGIESCECDCNSLIELINSLIVALQYHVDNDIYDISSDILYKALLEIIGGEDTSTPINTVVISWGYYDSNPLTIIQSQGTVNYQFTRSVPTTDTTEDLDFTSDGSGKYLVIKQDKTDIVYTKWSFSPFNNGTFTNDSVFKDPIEVGDYRYYISRSPNGVFYELNNKLTITK